MLTKECDNPATLCAEVKQHRIMAVRRTRMATEDYNWDKEWQGLEPEQPQAGRCGCWLGVLLLLISLFATCVGTGYFAWRQLDLPIDPGAALARSTIPPLASLEPEANPVIGTPESQPVATLPPLVATVTLPSAGATNEGDDVATHLFTTAPQIDGNLSEWDVVPGVESSHLVFSTNGWDQTDDVRAIWQLGWDQGNLYVAVRVEDDTHVQTESGSTIFKGDGVSLQVDTQRTADFGPGLSPDDFQINLSPGDFAGNPMGTYRYRGTDSGELTDSPGHNISLSTVRSGEGYTLEAAIPWNDLGIAPEPGLQLGIALNVNDNDTPGTAVQEVMKSHVATRKYSDPTSWGTVTLR